MALKALSYHKFSPTCAFEAVCALALLAERMPSNEMVGGAAFGATPTTSSRPRKAEAMDKNQAGMENGHAGAIAPLPCAATPPGTTAKAGKRPQKGRRDVCNGFPRIDSFQWTQNTNVQGSSHFFRGLPVRRRLRAPSRPPPRSLARCPPHRPRSAGEWL